MFSNKNRYVRLPSLCLIALILLLAACSTSSPASSLPSPVAQKNIVALSPSPTITGPVTPGLKNCKPASPIDNSPVGPEAQGTATKAEFTFPVAGCWDLHATRGNASGDVWLKIV